MSYLIDQKAVRLFVVLGGFFIANALVAEFIGGKIFALEDTLGIPPFEWNLFGQAGSLNFTAGVLLWPIVFVMTDIINEYFGLRGVRFLSFLTVGLISYAFLMIFAAIELAPADWWIEVNKERGTENMQAAFANVAGQSNWIIVGSLVAFLIGQLVDVLVFQRIRRITGERFLWLRATGSTLISQFIDSFVVLFIAFVLGPQRWSIELFLAIGLVNYLYKFVMAIVLTPLIYLAHYWIDRYLGTELAVQLKTQAALNAE